MPVNQRFRNELSHCEDLMFYLEQADQGSYDHTTEPVLFYRRTAASAMSDLEGLERGYKTCVAIMKKNQLLLPYAPSFARKARSMMWKSFLKSGRPMRALKSWIHFFS